MIKIYILSLFIFSTVAFAGSSNQSDDLTAAVKLASSSLENVNDATVQKQPCDIPPDPPVPLADEFSLKGINDGCDKFLNNEGEPGEWGNIILKKIESLPEDELKDSFYSNNIPDMPFVCQNFSEFSNELKKKFWVWTFASIAWEESSCKPKAAAAGVNCKAVGLLQLEGSARLRKGRGESCQVAEVTTPKNNLACGVDILNDQLLGQKSNYFKGTKATGELFWKSSYWLHMRLKGKDEQQREATKRKLIKSVATDNQKPDIKTLVMRFPYCR